MPFRRARRATFFHLSNNKPNRKLALLWSYKLLIEMKLWRKLYNERFIDDSVYQFLGLAHLIEDDRLKVKQNEFLHHLKQKSAKYEKNSFPVNKVLAKNINKLNQFVSLNECEQKIIVFAVILQSVKEFQDITDELGELSLKDIYSLLSFLLEIPYEQIRTVLHPSQTLYQAGLIRIDPDINNEIYRRIDIMTGLSDSLLLPDVDFNAIFTRYFNTTGESSLTKSNFDYLQNQIQLMENILRVCKQSDEPITGVNILLYGPPGTGKTELAKVIAKSVGLKLHEIAMSDTDGEAVKGDARFSFYYLAQQVLKRNKNNIIVFDEIEDVFPQTTFLSFNGDSKGQKAWVNRLLETNQVPAIWISNAVSQIDDAYKRRFQLVIKMDIPPQQTRLKIIKECVKKLPVSSEWLQVVAKKNDLSPALISQSANMVSLLYPNADKNKSVNSRQIESDLNQIINNNLELMDKKKIIFNQNLTPISYNIRVVNPDYDIQQLVSGLARHQQGRICLYGPPGTGKTAFGHYVAEKLKQRLLVKRASDILSMWVGESEKNIANMFAEAKQENAVLMLDEADSFLRDRKEANVGWEVTQVNELLTQMESFEGIFICSTNLIDDLDEASIRRFDVKIKLDYCTTEQVFLLFKQVLKEQQAKFSKQAYWKQRLSVFDNLTPGDFATVIRKNRLSPEPMSPEILFAGLQKESEFKSRKEQQHGIGFTAEID